MNLRILTTLAVMAAALLSSCSSIEENIDDCPPDYKTRILVKLEAEELGVSPLPEYAIQTVWVYAFDAATGAFEGAWDGGPYVPGKEYEATFDLPAGDYKFVAWTNLHEDVYGVSHTAEEMEDKSIGDLYVYFNAPATGGAATPRAATRAVTGDLPDLLHGTKDDAVHDDRDHTVTILIRQHVYRVTFVVTGLTETDDKYGFTVYDRDIRRDFQNNIIQPASAYQEYTYERTTQFQQGAQEPQLTATMTILGLTGEQGRIAPTFTFQNIDTPEWLYPWHGDGARADLVDMIIKTYKAQNNGAAPDFSTTFEFLVPLRFDAKLGVGLDLRAWNYMEDEWALK